MSQTSRTITNQQGRRYTYPAASITVSIEVYQRLHDICEREDRKIGRFADRLLSEAMDKIEEGK